MKNISLLAAGLAPFAAGLAGLSGAASTLEGEATFAVPGEQVKARLEAARGALAPIAVSLGRDVGGERLLVAQWINCRQGGWRNC